MPRVTLDSLNLADAERAQLLGVSRAQLKRMPQKKGPR